MTAPAIRWPLAALLVGALAASIGPGARAEEASSPADAPVKASVKPFVGTRTDTSAPIEITADTLEVKQNQQLAIFRGKVDAVQGDMRLRAEVLVVHYRDNKANPEQPGISKIEADGNVFVSSPQETAQGARGVYDVDRARIDLTGGVVLTQGENVVRGENLEMNLATGESKVVSSKTGTGRVRGLFVPDKTSDASKGGASSQKKN